MAQPCPTAQPCPLDMGGGGNFVSIGFFPKRFLMKRQKKVFCKVFFLKILNDVLKGVGFFLCKVLFKVFPYTLPHLKPLKSFQDWPISSPKF